MKSVSLSGDLRTEFTIDDQPSGLGWMPDGSMLVVSMIKRQVLRRAADGTISVHADLSEIAVFHCNDMVVDAAGHAYVGDFGFDLDAEIEARGPQSVIADHPTAGSPAWRPTARSVSRPIDMHFPNGSVITPGRQHADRRRDPRRRLDRFRHRPPPASLSGRRVWASTLPRVPDGICLDAKGAIWIANPLAPECVRIAEGGEVLEVIETGEPCFACMLGGEDGRTLFMLTAKTSNADASRAEPQGRLLIAAVEAPHAGLP